MRRQRQLGMPLEVEDVTLAEFAETYWELHAIPNLAPSTRAIYRTIWGRHILPRLGNHSLRTLTPKVLTRFRADLETAGVGTAMIRKTLALVQSILSFAVMEERLEFNAAAAVRKPRYERAREPQIFVPLDVERLRLELDARSAALVALLAYSGPRPEEALRLTWSDVGTEALHYFDSKRRRERWTPVLAPLAADLKAWRLISGRPAGSAPVIPAHDGGHWQVDDWRNWRRRTWGAYQAGGSRTGDRTWRGAAPAGSRPRDLRSSYITVQIYGGRPLTEIARHVGTSVDMIDRHYAGILANWDGQAVPAEQQIREARALLAQNGGRSVDVGGFTVEADETENPCKSTEALCRTRTGDPFLTMLVRGLNGGTWSITCGVKYLLTLDLTSQTARRPWPPEVPVMYPSRTSLVTRLIRSGRLG